MKQRIDIYANARRLETDDDGLGVSTLAAAAEGENGSVHKFRMDGPYAELTGVLHLGKNESARRNLLVMAHGFRGSMDGGGRAIELARQAQTYANVLRFNFSDCQTLSAQVQEMSEVVRAASRALRPDKLFLLGRSLGGATAIALASRDAKMINRIFGAEGADAREKTKEAADDIKITAASHTLYGVPLCGLILWSTPNNLEQTFRNVLTSGGFDHLLAGRELRLCDWRGEFTVKPVTVADMLEYDLGACLGKLAGTSVFIVHGTADTVVNPSEALANYDSCRNPRELYWVNGGDHSFIAESDEATRAVITWLQKHS